MKYWRELPVKLAGLPLATAVLSSVLLMAQGGSAPPGSAAANADEAAFRRVSNRLLCQCGCSYMVLSCNHLDCNSATYIRRTIQTSLAAGKSEDAIVAAMVEQYGPRILPEPPRKGFSLTAWVMPFVVLLLGAALVSYVLWTWKFKNRLEAVAGVPTDDSSPPAQEPAPALVEKYRAQIDRELENE